MMQPAEDGKRYVAAERLRNLCGELLILAERDDKVQTC